MEKALREITKMIALDYARSKTGERYDDEKPSVEGHGVDGLHRFKLMNEDAIHFLESVAKDMSRYLEGELRKSEVQPFSKEWSETHAYAQKVYFSEVARNARKKLTSDEIKAISYK